MQTTFSSFLKSTGKICIILLAFLCAEAQAQTKHFPVVLSVFKESTAIPLLHILEGPTHPGLSVGTEFNYSKPFAQNRFFQTVNLSGYYHRNLNQAVTLLTELGYEHRTQAGIAFSALLGAGYMHSFRTNETYAFSNGEHSVVRNRGLSRLVPSFSVETGYYLHPHSFKSVKLFLRYQVWAEYPFSPGFIPVMPHTNIHAGARFFVKHKQ